MKFNIIRRLKIIDDINWFIIHYLKIAYKSTQTYKILLSLTAIQMLIK